MIQFTVDENAVLGWTAKLSEVSWIPTPRIAWILLHAEIPSLICSLKEADADLSFRRSDPHCCWFHTRFLWCICRIKWMHNGEVVPVCLSLQGSATKLWDFPKICRFSSLNLIFFVRTLCNVVVRHYTLHETARQIPIIGNNDMAETGTLTSLT